ncbi:two-component system regulatory protein YycI [Pseudogracilibacillus sp. SE30717A]|uniref:two-component system regulatory protein YycI n=1 Tax=Pseudogracilibacillus sp. SE30717A TaxID=3098293 RepID=UPI00300E6702
MHWGQIKSLLILSFLILDVYLFMQFLDKKDQADIGILEQQTSTIEERLNAEDITFKNLPEQEYEEAFISVQQKMFNKDELSSLKLNELQNTYLFNKYFLMSSIKEPIKIEEKASKEEINEIFEELVYYSEEYSYWNWNKELNVLIFFQNKMDRPVYYNQNGLVLLFLNNQNEVTFYTQTMLGDPEPIAEKKKLIKPIRAIETLYQDSELKSGDNISKVNIGFHTRVPFETGVQVFAPIWKVNVNNEKDYFVNAIEGFTFSTDEQEFLEQVIDSALEKVQIPSLDTDRNLEKMMNQLNERLEKTSG